MTAIAVQQCSPTWLPTSERKHYLPSPTMKLTGRQILGLEVVILPLCRRGCGPASEMHSLYQSEIFYWAGSEIAERWGGFSRGRC